MKKKQKPVDTAFKQQVGTVGMKIDGRIFLRFQENS